MEFSVIIYILLVVLLIVLICLGIKFIQTLYKIDKIIDEVQDKVRKLDSLFSIIDATSDTVTKINDYLVSSISKVIKKLIHPIKRKKVEDEEEQC